MGTVLALLKLGFSYAEILDLPEIIADGYINTCNDILKTDNSDNPDKSKPETYVVRKYKK